MILGVTGGIASGKSTITRIFSELGASVVSADELSREAVLPGTKALEALVNRFGRGILNSDGTLNRKGLASIIFADPDAREGLNAITHPAIAELAVRRLKELRNSGAALVVYEAPLLFEADAVDRVDAVLVVSVDETLQMKRLIERDGFTEAEARARVQAQIPQSEKIARADYVIDNSGPIEETREKVRALFSQLLGSEESPE